MEKQKVIRGGLAAIALAIGACAPMPPPYQTLQPAPIQNTLPQRTEQNPNNTDHSRLLEMITIADSSGIYITNKKIDLAQEGKISAREEPVWERKSFTSKEDIVYLVRIEAPESQMVVIDWIAKKRYDAGAYKVPGKNKSLYSPHAISASFFIEESKMAVGEERDFEIQLVQAGKEEPYARKTITIINK